MVIETKYFTQNGVSMYQKLSKGFSVCNYFSKELNDWWNLSSEDTDTCCPTMNTHACLEICRFKKRSWKARNCVLNVGKTPQTL